MWIQAMGKMTAKEMWGEMPQGSSCVCALLLRGDRWTMESHLRNLHLHSSCRWLAEWGTGAGSGSRR